ncbi:ATP-dependent nuclease [Vibrio campbellii]|uniref:ATP-dependent nuclease n=1 Tax=Vibrio campbellii TaxID=680 RepID=UPI0038576975
MKIAYFSINNFRGLSGGLENNTVNFLDTNTLFIYGQNNVGKSTILRAYDFFWSGIDPTTPDFYKSNQENMIEFEIEVILDDIDLELICQKYKKKADSFKSWLSEDNRLRIQKSWQKVDKDLVTKNYTYNYNTSEFCENSYASIGLHQVMQNHLPKPIFIEAMPTEEKAKAILNDILQSMARKTLGQKDLEELEKAKSIVQKLQEKMYKPGTVEKYQTSINDYFEKIFIDTYLKIEQKKNKLSWTEQKFGIDFDIHFKKKDSDGNVDPSIPTQANSMGHGTIRTAIFTLLLMRDVAEEFERKEGRKDYLVLFEEPELFLYPKIIKELRELIYSVSEDDLPYQVLCASHSPAMIDLSKPKSSIIRLTKDCSGTKLHQIDEKFLKSALDVDNYDQMKQEMYEVLRFNPFICESFYSDEVLLVEGPTEEVIARAYIQETDCKKDVFILNCGTVNNIPFYQKIFSQFKIKYHVVFDTDGVEFKLNDQCLPEFSSHIQKRIMTQYFKDLENNQNSVGLVHVHEPTFEPAHQHDSIPPHLRYVDEAGVSRGKPLNANLYWKNIIQPNFKDIEILKLPYISLLTRIFK